MLVYCNFPNGTCQQERRREKVITHRSLAIFPGKTVHSNEINIKQSSITMTICTVKTSSELANEYIPSLPLHYSLL